MIFMMFYQLKKVNSGKTTKNERNLVKKKNYNFTEEPFVASESEQSEEDDVEQIVKANLIAKSLLTPALDQKLGAWEAHTKV